MTSLRPVRRRFGHTCLRGEMRILSASLALGGVGALTQEKIISFARCDFQLSSYGHRQLSRRPEIRFARSAMGPQPRSLA